ncbi:MAG: hypothetical protein PSV18_02765 [Methylobacter sp.]|nr:hypothetical protein [Candidatus Methylobacter titanis]
MNQLGFGKQLLPEIELAYRSQLSDNYWKTHLEKSYRVTAYPKDIGLKMQRLLARFSEKDKRS